jgi:hypothetical protein
MKDFPVTVHAMTEVFGQLLIVVQVMTKHRDSQRGIFGGQIDIITTLMFYIPMCLESK